MNRKLIWALSLLGIVAFASCEKDNKYMNATVLDTGDITYEGCGYLLVLDNTELLKPLYLPGAFQHDGLKVRISYKHTGILDTCEYGTKLYDQVNVDDIKLVQE